MISINNLNYLKIIKNISFNIKENQFISLLGENGSGKTSILKCICGIYKDYSGEIIVKENDSSKMKQKDLSNYVSYVPQIVGTYIPFTVKDFLKMSLYSKKNILLSLKEEKISFVLDFLNLKKFEKRVVSTLSGGEMQKILLAAALTQDTPFLLLDEPTSHLDPKASRKLVNSLKLIKNEFKKGILMVSHKVNEVIELSDRIIAIENGKLNFDLPISKVNEEYLNETVYSLSETE